MTPNQLPPLPEPHIGLPWRHNAKDGSIHSSAFTWAQMHAYALAAIAQQAQEPAVPVVSEDDLVACLISSGCVGTVKMSFESEPMSITRPSLNATKFARAILALRPAVEPMTWPKGRDVGRYGDMSPGQHLRVGLDSDNDAYVSVWDEDGGASVEFCNPGGGGGGSSRRTREALIALMAAIEADNAERPDKDWWARRNGITAKAEGGA